MDAIMKIAMEINPAIDYTNYDDCTITLLKLMACIEGDDEINTDNDKINAMCMIALNTFAKDEGMLEKFAGKEGYLLWYIKPYLAYKFPLPLEITEPYVPNDIPKNYKIFNFTVMQVARLYLCLNYEVHDLKFIKCACKCLSLENKTYKKFKQINDTLRTLRKEFGTLQQYGSVRNHQKNREDAFN